MEIVALLIHAGGAGLLLDLATSRLSSNLNRLAKAVNTGSLPVSPGGKNAHSVDGYREAVTLAQGELEREPNRRLMVQKMKARVENGFWVFRVLVGYRYVNSPSGRGKELVPEEVLAPVGSQVLKGYTTGQFASQAEV